MKTKKHNPNLDWYSPPFTKEHIASLREKLATTHGILSELHDIKTCILQ